MQGSDPQAEPVLTGSHLDSQPTGGRFDGAYGVLAGLEALQALTEAGLRCRRPIELAVWMNEEGSRFAPGMMGSRVFAGQDTVAGISSVRDADGIPVAQELERLDGLFADVPRVPPGRKAHAYLEAHIEQGPILERQSTAIGVVTGIQGKYTYLVEFRGQEAHVGTVDLAERKDALLAAVAAIDAMAAEFLGTANGTRFSVCRLNVTPNVPSVIARKAEFSIDLRHPDSGELGRLHRRVEEICRAHAGPCEVSVNRLSAADSLEFPVQLRELVRQCASELSMTHIDILSLAGHDARYLHRVCPSGMIFIPCKDGVSHNEAESVRAEDLENGVRVLAAALRRLAA